MLPCADMRIKENAPSETTKEEVLCFFTQSTSYSFISVVHAPQGCHYYSMNLLCNKFLASDYSIYFLSSVGFEFMEFLRVRVNG